MKDFTVSDLPSPGIAGRIGNVEGRLFRDSGVVWERMYREEELRAAIAEECEACADVAQLLLGYTTEAVEYMPGVSKMVVDAIRARSNNAPPR